VVVAHGLNPTKAEPQPRETDGNNQWTRAVPPPNHYHCQRNTRLSLFPAMVQVLVLGATGFIGSAVALALRRAGHIVHALVRDPSGSKARNLERQEILTHKGDIKDETTWVELAARMDVVIDCAEMRLCINIFAIVLEAARARPHGAPRLTYIYTSSIWVHGHSRKQVTDRSSVIEMSSPKLTNPWRLSFEHHITSPDKRGMLEVFVVRPGAVFGGASPLFRSILDPLIHAERTDDTPIQVKGKKDALVPAVHREDLAQAFRLLVEKSTLLGNISNPIFDIANPVESFNQIVTAAASRLGLDTSRIEYVRPSSGVSEALSTSVNTSSERARDLLGWQARHPSFSAGMEVYMHAILAHR